MAMNDIIGKVVTVTANEEVGYGAEGNSVLGVVTNIYPAGTAGTELGFDGLKEAGTFKLAAATATTLGLTGDYLVTVTWGRTFVEVPINKTLAKKPTVGGFCIVDGTGKLAKIVDATAEVVGTGCKALSVDTTNDVATVKIV